MYEYKLVFGYNVDDVNDTLKEMDGWEFIQMETEVGQCPHIWMIFRRIL
jgi:hypothetical protein